MAQPPNDPTSFDESSFKQGNDATFRALSHTDDAKLEFVSSNHLHSTLCDHTLTIPWLSQVASQSEYNGFVRGLVDSHALFLHYHDPKLHDNTKQSLPKLLEIETLFDSTEHARIQALGLRDLTGINRNILNKLNYEYTALKLNERAPTTQTVPMHHLLPLLILKASYNGTLPEIIGQTIDHWKPYLPHALESSLKDIQAHLNDQKKFSHAMKHIIQHILFPDDQRDAPPEPSEQPDDIEASTEDSSSEQNNHTQDTLEPVSSFEATDLDPDAMPDTQLPIDDANETSSKEANIPNQPFFNNAKHYAFKYQAFTTEYDEIIAAEELCDLNELKRLRQLLDDRLRHLPNIPRVHTHLFLSKLFAKQHITWQYGLDEGMIDHARLALPIANPNYQQFYKQSAVSHRYNTVVTLLLDNSGSMRGRPITLAAMSAELLTQTLEVFGIKVEILGFTTANWKGGKSRAKWQEQGSPPNPGRLNDLRHIIYKPATMPWRRARANLGLMLKEGILKENIDGEAVLWAYQRIMARPEPRKILMVISDGSPVDDSTASNNQRSSYLESHLKLIVSSIEKEKLSDIIAIGIGHDVSPFYNHAVTIKDASQLSEAMFKELATIL